jgi:hypothetical protein
MIDNKSSCGWSLSLLLGQFAKKASYHFTGVITDSSYLTGSTVTDFMELAFNL